MNYHLGIDIGSVSVKAVVINERKEIAEERYVRHYGEPQKVAQREIEDLSARFDFGAVATTGSGGKLIPGRFVNEIVAQSKAVAALHPDVRTVIEIGGEDSKLFWMKKGRLADFLTNTVCAAGTGSFLDQQASRLGLNIEEFSRLALKSKNPPRIAGRCTVFAKSDMIHLQQKGTPDYEIVAGLCLALARSFISNAGKQKRWERPIAFQGGVAANPGVVRAFERVLGVEELVIPKHFASMGAIGAVLSLL
jgi:predicted CoA-substrate-specific enzyme activase